MNLLLLLAFRDKFAKFLFDCCFLLFLTLFALLTSLAFSFEVYSFLVLFGSILCKHGAVRIRLQLIRPVELDTYQKRRTFFGLEHVAFIRGNVQHCVVPNR